MNPTTHQYLEWIRARPALHLGNLGRNSIVALSAFMRGLQSGSCPDPDPPYGGFTCWVASLTDNTMPWEMLINKLGDEAAYMKFFELYDEYRQCHRMYLQRAVMH